jgi:hypothetical protein
MPRTQAGILRMNFCSSKLTVREDRGYAPEICQVNCEESRFELPATIRGLVRRNACDDRRILTPALHSRLCARDEHN